MGTLFSKIVKGEVPSYKIAEDELFYAFLDINPLMKGHTLVIPKKEVDYFFDVEDALLKEYSVFTKKVAKAIKAVIPCNRVGMTVIGLEVPHAHIHLVPINTMNDMNFANPKLNFEKEEFERVAKSIEEAFTSIG